MRQREGHIMHLAEETAVLKDQVDALRELSVMVLKDDSGSSTYRSSFPPSAVVLDSPVSLYLLQRSAFHMWLEGCPNPCKMEQSWKCTF